jgi:aminoglycoside phosphotransferase (APT) family kinase protein
VSGPAALDGVLVDVGDLLGLIEERAVGVDRPDLVRAARHMPPNAPPPGREAICHGDLHPFNLLVDKGHVSVVDWILGLVADPAFDLAFTGMVMAMAPQMAVRLSEIVGDPVRPM